MERDSEDLPVKQEAENEGEEPPVEDDAHEVREVRAVPQLHGEQRAEHDHDDAISDVADHQAEEDGEEEERVHRRGRGAAAAVGRRGRWGAPARAVCPPPPPTPPPSPPPPPPHDE